MTAHRGVSGRTFVGSYRGQDRLAGDAGAARDPKEATPGAAHLPDPDASTTTSTAGDANTATCQIRLEMSNKSTRCGNHYQVRQALEAIDKSEAMHDQEES